MVTSWLTVCDAGVSDECYSSLLHALQSDTDQHLWNTTLAPYEKYRKDLTTVDGVVLYKGRVVVPPVLQPQVLHNLHLAHLGTTGMALRTSNSVWWPKISEDIQRVRSQCSTCQSNAP